MPALSIKQLRKTYGATTAVDSFDLDVAEGEFVSLLGPSGCGKTTILRMVAGLITPDSGQIVIAGKDVTHVPVHKRNVGLVFQSYALFPHMTVFDNVAFGLRRNNLAEDKVKERVITVLSKVRLEGLEDRFPKQLSGGQQQRVALARAIAPEPTILLLDEPLSNLDKQLRMNMQIELKRLQRDVGVTTIFVTHDQSEAMAMSDRICVLESGKTQQIGVPEDLYHRPENKFIATFLGRSNSFTASIGKSVSGKLVQLDLDEGIQILATASDKVASSGKVHVTIRHETVKISKNPPDKSKALNRFKGKVIYRAFSGSIIDYVVTLDDGPEFLLEATNVDGERHALPGAEVWISFEAGAVLVNELGDQ
ncbi:MAG: Fe3+/spermidine/putrescine ABC transporter ATP-binding protein [Blastopirellula sp.]|nr:MAG: Fe3+/spermidine/putrescine ABC transporter ATP-binding protein [Blastopirellula sp.]